MIERILWGHHTQIGELPSPFQRGKGERPLRITFHTASLVNLPDNETAAVEALRELAHLPEVEALETEPGISPYIKVGAIDEDTDYIPITVFSKDEPKLFTGIGSSHQWPEIAARLVHKVKSVQANSTAMLEDLILAQAHRQVRGDILITSSPLLLELRNETWVREANPRTPTEAAQIVGLFLRSRGMYTYSAGSGFRKDLDRGFFYWILTRHRLPSMWRYFSACVAAEKAQGDDIQGLGQSILVRCVRALEARDAIGEQFYMTQNNNTRDCIMYHFDYLTLVLAGALDAQACVARRAYNIHRDERHASFRDKNFRKCLKQSGAIELQEIVNDQYYRDVTTLLYEPRNTIHRTAFTTLAYKLAGEPEVSFVSVPEPIASKLWNATERLGSAERWGLSKGLSGVLLEPYSYATALVCESFKLTDAIAAATDVARLFPESYAVPSLKENLQQIPHLISIHEDASTYLVD